MKQEEFNNLPLEEKADLLWGPFGSGIFYEVMCQSNSNKMMTIYFLNNIIVSANYDIETNKIVDIKALGELIDKKRILENLSMN